MASKEYHEALRKAHYYDMAERYEDMAAEMKRAVEYMTKEGQELSVSARNSFSLAFKDSVSSRRNSWRVLNSERQKIEEKQPEELYIIDEIIKKVENELLSYCDEVLSIIEDYILPRIEKCSLAHNVFFLKMKGDYYRYMAEIRPTYKGKNVIEEAQQSYVEAKKLADGLSFTDPIRLGLYLNFSVFQYEIMGNTNEACKLAKTAFDAAISELDTLSEDYYKDSTLIMQLLRDNLTLWSSRGETSQPKCDNVEAAWIKWLILLVYFT